MNQKRVKHFFFASQYCVTQFTHTICTITDNFRKILLGERVRVAIKLSSEFSFSVENRKIECYFYAVWHLNTQTHYNRIELDVVHFVAHPHKNSCEMLYKIINSLSLKQFNRYAMCARLCNSLKANCSNPPIASIVWYLPPQHHINCVCMFALARSLCAKMHSPAHQIICEWMNDMW